MFSAVAAAPSAAAAAAAAAACCSSVVSPSLCLFIADALWLFHVRQLITRIHTQISDSQVTFLNMWRADTRSAGGDGCGWESDDTQSGWCSHTSSNRSEWRWGDCWSGAESSSEWELRKRVKKLEKQMHQVLEGRLMTSTGADDARGSQLDEHERDLLESLMLVPKWYGSGRKVPVSQLERANHCRKSGFHLRSPYFADHDWYEDTMDFWDWLRHLQSSGLEEFADRVGDINWQRDTEAQYDYAYLEGKTQTFISVVCQHCRAMIEVKTDSAKLQADDEAVLELFLLKKFAHPKAIVR